jgi:hypothetical protein
MHNHAMYAALHTLQIPPCRLLVLYLYAFDCFEVMLSKRLLGMGVEGFERGRRKEEERKGGNSRLPDAVGQLRMKVTAVRVETW